MTESSKITDINLKILRLFQILTPQQQEYALELAGLMAGTDKIVMEFHDGKAN